MVHVIFETLMFTMRGGTIVILGHRVEGHGACHL